MFAGLFINFVNAGVPENLVLLFCLVSLPRTELGREAQRMCIAQSFQGHKTSLSQVHFGTGKSLVCRLGHLCPRNQVFS